jgi:hypothetical protein
MVDSALPDGVVRVHPAAMVAFNPNTHKIEYGNPAMIDGKWVEQASVVELPPSEAAARQAEAAGGVRATRDMKLKASDWTQMPDAPVDKQAWATYRQALRDVPAQAGFPFDVSWPVAP